MRDTSDLSVHFLWVLVFPIVCWTSPVECPAPAITSTTARPLALFGETCSEYIECKPSSWLFCDGGSARCRCYDPENMIWDTHRSACVMRVGKSCIIPTSDGWSTKTVVCSHNTWCKPYGPNSHFCECTSSLYYHDEEGQCSRKKALGVSCSSPHHCNDHHSLSCNNVSKTCDCAVPSYMMADPVEGRCRIFVGFPCDIEKTRCVGTASCRGPNGNEGSGHGICKCPEGQHGSDDGTLCLPGRPKGAPCSKDEECDVSLLLSCSLDGICSCDPRVSVVNENGGYVVTVHSKGTVHKIQVPIGTCLAKAGLPCTPWRSEHGRKQHSTWGRNQSRGRPQVHQGVRPTQEVYCFPPATCGFTGTCDCHKGLTQVKGRLCGRGHGSPCGPSEPCTKDYACDYSSVKCECRSPEYQIYDGGIYECRAKAGASCDTLSCVENASCIIIHRGNSRCECNDGFVFGSSGNCELEYNQSCSRGDTCDGRSGLKCVDRETGGGGFPRCLCPNEEDVFDEQGRRCVRREGAPCKDSSDCLRTSWCSASNRNKGPRCA